MNPFTFCSSFKRLMILYAIGTDTDIHVATSLAVKNNFVCITCSPFLVFVRKTKHREVIFPTRC